LKRTFLVLAAALLVGCTTAKPVPTPSASASSVSVTQAPAAPAAPAVRHRVVRREMKAAAAKALRVYLATPVGARESHAIDRIAARVRRTTGCGEVGIPAFASALQAHQYVSQAIRAYGLQMFIFVHGQVTNPRIIARVKSLIEFEYDSKVTVKSATLTVAVFVGGCNIRGRTT